MHPTIRFWMLGIVIASLGLGCRALSPAEQPPGNEQQSLEQRTRAFRDEAMRDRTLTPTRKAELLQLAAEVRAWEARTGQNDLRVTEESLTTARRANDGGGGGDCEDCPGYLLEGDRLCLLTEAGVCPVDEDDGSDLTIGMICAYTCIWIGSGAAPSVRNGAD